MSEQQKPPQGPDDANMQDDLASQLTVMGENLSALSERVAQLEAHARDNGWSGPQQGAVSCAACGYLRFYPVSEGPPLVCPSCGHKPMAEPAKRTVAL